jgi:hypothetical protein
VSPAAASLVAPPAGQHRQRQQHHRLQAVVLIADDEDEDSESLNSSRMSETFPCPLPDTMEYPVDMADVVDAGLGELGDIRTATCCVLRAVLARATCSVLGAPCTRGVPD